MLARDLGRTLHELCETMTAYEFGLWIAEYQRKPWGDVRLDLNAALIVQAVENYAGKMRKDPAKLQDCILRFTTDEEDNPPPDPMEHFNQFR